MIEEKEKLQDISDFERTDEVALGLSLTFAGTAIAGLGVLGIDTFEAKTAESGILNVDLTSVSYEGNYITAPDIGFGAIALVGVGMGYVGLRKLLGRKTR